MNTAPDQVPAQTHDRAANQSGQNLLEYASLAGVIALGCVLATGGLGLRVDNALNTIGTRLTGLV